MLNSFAVLEKKTLWMHQIGGIDFYNIPNRVFPIRPTADKNKLGNMKEKKLVYIYTVLHMPGILFLHSLPLCHSTFSLDALSFVPLYIPIWGLESDLAMGDGWLESQHCIFVYFNAGLPY